jgi:hypothetical protein
MKERRTTVAILLRCSILLAGACLFSATAYPATPPDSVRHIVSELRRFPVDPDNADAVPQPVATNLTRLKHALRDLIVDVVAAPDAVKSAPDVLAARVIERLEGEGVPVGDEGGYGAIPRIEFRRPPEYPAWLVATTSLSIPYGLDTSLYLFETQGSSWRHVLTVESNGYKEISGAQGWLTYYVAPPVPHQKPYLVTADITPSPVSVWQDLRVTVLRVGGRPETPIVLASRELNYCLDDAYYFSIRAGGFGLIYLTSAVDPELAGYRGVHYLEYAVGTDRALRVKEVTIDPSVEIRRWEAKDWPAASRSVDASAAGDLREWHQRFQRERWACDPGDISLSHRTDGDHEQLLAVAGCTRGDEDATSAYVVFVAGHQGFHIASISQTKPALPEDSGYMIYGPDEPGLTAPVLVSSAQPRLPADFPVHGRVPPRLQLAIVVNEDGTVDRAVTIRKWPSDESRIVVPAIQAVRQWKYRPGLKDGHRVKVAVNVEVVFEH